VDEGLVSRPINLVRKQNNLPSYASMPLGMGILRMKGYRSSYSRTCALVVGASLAIFNLGYSDGRPEQVFKKGAIYGKIVDLSGKPVCGAIVALRLPDGKILSWARTDASGSYAMSADPKVALSLKPSHCKDLLEQCADAVGAVVMVPVKLATSPGPTIHAALVSVASGTPAPLAAQAVEATLPNQTTVSQVSQASGGAAADVALGGGPQPAPLRPEDKGRADILVAAKGFKDGNLVANAYWLDPANNDDRGKPVGVQAYLDTIRLAPTSDVKAKDEMENEAYSLSEGVAEPNLAPPGSMIDLHVRLDSAPDEGHRIRIFARLTSKDNVVELTQCEKDKCLFTGLMYIDPRTPAGDTTICFGALRANPVEVKLNPDRPNALKTFVSRLVDMNGDHPYGYDPFVMASENRLDVKLTVLPKMP
jgi:hypothetical protein